MGWLRRQNGVCLRCAHRGYLYRIDSPHFQRSGCDFCHWFKWSPA